MSRNHSLLILTGSPRRNGNSATVWVMHQIQEYSRYTHSRFIGVVRGIGNRRSEVINDPGAPVEQAEESGREFCKLVAKDYRVDTERKGNVWLTYQV